MVSGVEARVGARLGFLRLRQGLYLARQCPPVTLATANQCL